MYKRTKIVCTMGPACDSDETIREMIKAGMNVARFNFSHGSYDEHHGRIERVRRISEELGLPVGILLDTKGPEVRTGLLVDGQEGCRQDRRQDRRHRSAHVRGFPRHL